MSGGSLNYFYSDLEAHANDFGDKELNDLVCDLAKLFHDREWYLSSDTCEGAWNEARDAFKEKWFTAHGCRARIEKYLAEIGEEVLKMFGMSRKYCQYCKHWMPEKDGVYGWCAFAEGHLNHKCEACECGKWEKKCDS